MTFVFWVLMLIVTATALGFHFIPRFSRPDILFGVTVSEAFVAGEGRTLVSRYRTTVWVGAAAALAIGLLLQPPDDASWGMVMPGVLAGYSVFAHVAWQWARQKARAHAVPPSDVRVASLVTRDTSLPGGTLFAAGPFAILLATAVLVYTNRGAVPNDPDTANPFGQLAFGAVLVAMGLAMAVTLAGRSRQIAVDGPAAAAEQRFRRVNTLAIVLAGYAVAILTSTWAAGSVLPFGDALSGWGWFVPVLMMLLNFGVAVWVLRVGQGGQRAVAAAARRDVHGDGTPDHAWKVGGLYYVNPHDPAMWVENRFGFGYTLNFGNWRAWLLIIAMMLVPMFAGRLLFGGG